MLIAIFNDTTGWAGKTISHDGAHFVLEGFGPITPQQVLVYESSGQIAWASASARALAHSKPASAPEAKPKRRLPGWVLIAAIGIVAIILIGAIAAARSMNEAVEQVGGGDPDLIEIREVPGKASGGGGTLTTVFTWPGGGASNDIRNSQPFTLHGGHQVFSFTAAPAGEYADMAMVSWTVEPVDGGMGEMIHPSTVAAGSSDMYLDAGQYYVSSNTVAATWTVTITETR